MFTLPESNSSHLKMDGWNTTVSFWGKSLFSGAFAVSFTEGMSWDRATSCKAKERQEIPP